MAAARVALLSALWLGIMTSISPCPLATNIAAVSFLAKRITHPLMVLAAGMAYTAGRMASYAALGLILVNSILGVPETARFLQKYIAHLLGPILIITGLILLGIFRINLPGISISHKHQNKLAEAGIPGAFLLGTVFALAFCPVSAALFFGGLIPLALKSGHGVSLPLVYGIGTGLPVLIFSFAIAAGVTSLDRWFHKIAKIEHYMRKVAGAIFILAGIYYIAAYSLVIF